MKFKVGDRVRVKGSEPGWFFKLGDTGKVVEESEKFGFRYAVEFDNGRVGYCDDSHIEPLSDPITDPAPATPRVKTRYAVTAELPTTVTVWHDTFDEALNEAKRLTLKCGKPFHVLKAVAEVKPAEPEVIEAEE